MKKTLAILLAVCLLAALSACGSGDIYIHDAPETQAPAPAETSEPVVAEPDPQVLVELGEPVILNIKNTSETFPAPDGSDRVILTYGYDDVDVYLASNLSAADAINQELATQDEIFYSGSGNGDGINAVLEVATDNYALTQDHDVGLSTEFSCTRTAFVDRADSRVIALRYRTSTYVGGAHGTYVDRVLVFDTESGRRLSVDDLAADREALEHVILEKMNDVLHNDVRYLPILDYMTAFDPDADVEVKLRSLIRDGSWTLDHEGLTVFSDLYEIGSYADGIVRFTVPYEELNGVLDDAWLPPVRTSGGELHIMGLDDRNGNAVHLLDKVTISDDGSEFRVFADGTVYDVSIDSVTYINDDIGFYQTETHWYCSYLSNVGVQVQTVIPEGMPDLMIRYTDESGAAHRYLITESGEDGSVLLLEESKVVAVG